MTYHRLQGEETKPVLIFAHSLGVDHGQWDLQTAALLPDFKILRYDLRGHGASEVTPGDYSIEMLGRDVITLVDKLEIKQFAFCGLSIGGMIGQWLGANAADRLTHLILANTSPKFADTAPMEARRQTVLKDGMDTITDTVMGRFFSGAADAACVASTRRTMLTTDPVGYAGCCAAIRDMDLRPLLSKIKTKTLLISGDFDVSTPWTGNMDLISAALPGAPVVHLPTAHLSNLEAPDSFSAALTAFLQ
jgi:3-oxoadipate enol-lactonase